MDPSMKARPDRVIEVVEYLGTLIAGTTKRTAEVVVIIHGTTEQIGRNFVAVIGGDLCSDGDCHWCDNLRKRCISRRKA